MVQEQVFGRAASVKRMVGVVSVLWLLLFGLAIHANATPVSGGTPSITVQPVSTTVTVGDTATFTVTPADTGSSTVNLQWQFLSGTTWITFDTGEQDAVPTGSPMSFSLAGVDASLNGKTIRVSVTDPVNANSTDSVTVTLSVQTAAAITSSPSNQTVAVGSPGVFVASASGNPVPTFVWMYSLNGSPFQPFGGGTATTSNGGLTSTLTTNNASAAGDGIIFKAVATNTTQHGSNPSTDNPATSDTATLYVLKPPTITAGPTISGGNGGTFYHGQTATISATAIAPTEASSGLNGGTVSYQWYQGTAPGGTPVGTGSPLVVSNIESPAAGSYYVVATYQVDALSASVTSSPVTITVTPGFWKDAGTLPSGLESFARSVLLPNGHVMAYGSDFNDLSDSTDAHSVHINIDSTAGYGEDPDTWTSSSASLVHPLQRSTATLLPTGDVLIAGGVWGSTDQNTSYLFNEYGSTVTATTGHLATSRDSHTASLLNTGKVFVAGGYSGGVILKTTELYDPSTQTWSAGASLATARYRHTATVLADGTVLVAGGQSTTGSLSALSSAELYNPATNTWVSAGTMSTKRVLHAATLLPDGTVLVTGGINGGGGTLSSAEIYTPNATPGVAGTWATVSSPMLFARNQHTSTLLSSGQVLIAGGASGGTYQPTATYYDPIAKTFTQTQSMITPRDRAAALLTRNGKVLEVGGTTTGDVSLSSTEKFKPETGATPAVPHAAIFVAAPWVTADLLSTNSSTATCGLANGDGPVAHIGSTTPEPNVTYVWTVLGGTITSGQGTPSIAFTANVGATDHVELYCLATSSLGIPGQGSYAEPIAFAPSIVAQPSNQNILVGGTGTFVASASGYPIPTIAWQYSINGSPFKPFGGGVATSSDGGHTSTLVTNAATVAADEIMFRAVATNPVAPVADSSSATLRVNAVPHVSVSANPSNGIADQNGGMTLTATVTGDHDPNYSYQWTGPNGILGGNSNVLSLGDLQPSDAGNYSVTVTNTNILGGTDNTTQYSSSSPFAVQVYTPAQVSDGPSNSSVVVGNPGTFSASISGNPTPTVSWLYSIHGSAYKPFGGGRVTTGSGITTLVTNNATIAADGIMFEVVATNPSAAGPANTSTSAPATLTVVAAPGPVTVTPSSRTVPQGHTITFTASSTAAGVGQTVNYQWCKGTPSSNCQSSVGTGASLCISDAVLADGGSYYVIATDVSDQNLNVVSTPVVSSAVSVVVEVGEWSQVRRDMYAPRYEAMSLMLPDGRFWLAGGQNDQGLLNNDDLYTFTGFFKGWLPSIGIHTSFVAGPHLDGTASLLPGGDVLIAGGSDGQDGKFGIEIYDPIFHYFASNQTLQQPTTSQVAAVLPNQSVLLAGGSNGWSDTFYNNAYLFTHNPLSPGHDTLVPSSASMGTARAGSRSVVLGDGRVLIVGGQDVNGVDNAVDIYDPNGTTSYQGSLYSVSGNEGDQFASALCNADVGNQPGNNRSNPAFHGTGSMCLNAARLYHTATLLNDGRVLIAGGTDGNNALDSLEIWDPRLNCGQGGFKSIGSLSTPRMAHSAVLLENGKVLIFGGEDSDGNSLNTAEVVDPDWQWHDQSSASIPASSMGNTRLLASSALLPDGTVLTAGGIDPNAEEAPTRASAEIFTALEGYSTAPPEGAMIQGGYHAAHSQTGLTASITDDAPGFFTNYSWALAGGSITTGQGTSGVTFNTNSRGAIILGVQVTDQWGLTHFAIPVPPPTCNVPTGATVNTIGEYVASEPNSAFLTGLNLNNVDGTTIQSITWSLTGSADPIDAVSTNGSPTSGDSQNDAFQFQFPDSGDSITLNAVVTVLCPDSVTNSATFSFGPTSVSALPPP